MVEFAALVLGTAMNLSATRTSLLLALALLATGAAPPSTPPVPISSHEVTAADYPVESVAAQEVGTTRVDYLVRADGTVGDTMIAQLIERQISISGNWGVAGALSVLLLVATGVVLLVVQRLISVQMAWR